MIIEKRSDDEDVTVVIDFEDNIALFGNFEIKIGQLFFSEKGCDLVPAGDNYIGLMGNLDDGPPINIIISKEIFGYMKEVFEK